MKFAWIFSDFLENAEKHCNFSKFLDFNLIFIMIIPEIYLIFDGIFDSILNSILTEPPHSPRIPPVNSYAHVLECQI